MADRSRVSRREFLTAAAASLTAWLLARDLGIATEANLADLTSEQWVGVFCFILRCAAPRRRRIVFGCLVAQ